MRSAINSAVCKNKVCKNKVCNSIAALCVKTCNVAISENSHSCLPLESQAQLESHSSLLVNANLCSTTSFFGKSCRNSASLMLPHLLCYNSTFIPHIYLCSVRFQATAGNTRSGRSFSSSSPSSSSSRPYGGGRNNNSNSNNNNNNKDNAGRPINTPFKKHTNSTEDGELSKETVAAMRDDGIILEELFRNIPPNGAISLKSLSALISDTVKEALSERHNGLVSFIRERKHFFLLKERPEDKVFFVAANPLARQKYATREVQKRTMRDLMGLNSSDSYGTMNNRNYSRGNDNGNRNRGRGGSYGGNSSNNYSGERGGNNNYSNHNNREDNRYGRGNNNNNNNNYERGGERGNSYNDRRSGSQRGFGNNQSNNNNNTNNERNYNRERGAATGGGNGSGRDSGSYQRRSFNNGGNRDRGRS